MTDEQNEIDKAILYLSSGQNDFVILPTEQFKVFVRCVSNARGVPEKISKLGSRISESPPHLRKFQSGSPYVAQGLHRIGYCQPLIVTIGCSFQFAQSCLHSGLSGGDALWQPTGIELHYCIDTRRLPFRVP